MATAIGLVIWWAIVPDAGAVLPEDAHKKFIERYLSKVDTRAEVEFVGAKRRWFVRQNCVASYVVRRVIGIPVGLPLKEGDRISLRYHGDKAHNSSHSGSRYPWAEAAGGGRFLMRVPASYLKRIEVGSWELDNSKDVFGPVLPKAAEGGRDG